MTYIILEIQKMNDGTVSIVPPVTFTDRDKAEQKYHTVLSYASVSSCDVHTCAMLTDEGGLVKKETYYHGHEVEEEE